MPAFGKGVFNLGRNLRIYISDDAECDPNYRNAIKESVLIMAAEGAGFDETVYWYDHIKKHIGWKSLGRILCGHVTQPQDTDGKKELTD